jgi:competence protein ComEA
MDPFDDPDPLAALRPPPAAGGRDRLGAVLDAMGMSPARAVVAAVALVVAGVGAVWLLRPPPAPVEATLPMAEPAPVATSTTAPADVVVHVAGAVVQPGVLALPAGSRVVDAIDAAGGAAPDADLGRLNLAAEVADGERVYVPTVGEVVPAPVVGGSSRSGDGSAGPPPLVDLNTASVDELDALPGVGPATAQAIVDWREERGGFTSVDQLLDVRGIGEAKLAQLRDLVTV